MSRDEATVRIGTRRRKAPTSSYEELLSQPTREAEDDGAIILHAGDFTPVCRDCRRGHLLWAEAGYVPWHRICDVCGSHWELHPITWGPARPSRPTKPVLPAHAAGCDVYWEDAWSDENGPRPCSCGAQPMIDAAREEHLAIVARSGALVRWVDGRGEVPLSLTEPLADYDELIAATWGDLLALVTPEMWAAAEREKKRMSGMVVVPCAWARRARFY